MLMHSAIRQLIAALLQAFAGQGLAGLDAAAIEREGEADLPAIVAVGGIAAGEGCFEDNRCDINHTIAKMTTINDCVDNVI